MIKHESICISDDRKKKCLHDIVYYEFEGVYGKRAFSVGWLLMIWFETATVEDIIVMLLLRKSRNRISFQ